MNRSPRVILLVALAATATALALGGCAPADEEASTSATSGAGATAAALVPGVGECAKDQLDLHEPGMLTVATDKPAYAPWFVDDNPSNGQGFESAVAYAVADELGFSKDQVRWAVASFNSVIKPGDKDFDFDINQVSISDERQESVDFSSGYYDVAQAVVTIKGSKIAEADTIADLKSAKLGAQVGTTSYETIVDVVQPDEEPAVYDKNDDAKLALANGQIDGLVVDLPTALYLAAAELDDGVVVGQFASSSGTPEQFGLVLDLHSPLTGCVSAAVDSLRTKGTLEELETRWLTEAGGAPLLR
jgi:polar amino acid transport system substrate-binding protein